MTSNTLRLILFLSALLSFIAGWQGTSGHTTAAETPAPQAFVLPAYAQVPFDEIRITAVDDIEDHRADVQALFAEREKIPEVERNRLIGKTPPVLTRDLDKEAIDYYHKHIVQNYLDTTTDTGPTRDAGAAFLNAYVNWHVTEWRSFTPEIARLSDEARSAGSNDPIVCFCQLLVKNEPAAHLVACYQALAPAFQSPKISTHLRAHFASRFALDSWRITPDPTRSERMYAAIDMMVEHLEARSNDKNLRIPRWLLLNFQDGLSLEHQRHLLAACWSNGKIAPWITHMAAGFYFVDRAWKERGSGWASEVTKEGFEGFEKNLKIAEDHYLRAWQLAPQHPNAAGEMIRIAMAGQSSHWTQKDWLFEAVHAQFDYMNAYHSYTFAITPRWGGSHQEMLDFARQCIETDRHDTSVPGHFLKILLDYIVHETGDLAAQAKDEQVGELTKAYAKGLSAAVTRGENCEANRLKTWGILTRVLTLGEHYEDSKVIYLKHGQGELGTNALGIYHLKASYVRGLTYAATGPAKKHVATLQSALNVRSEEDLDIQKLNELQDTISQARQADTQPESRSYYDDMDAVVQQLKQYYTDQWVTMPFNEQLVGWNVTATGYRVLPEGVLEVESSQNAKGIEISPVAQFRPPFLFDVEITPGREGQTAGGYGALIYGASHWNTIYARQKSRSIFYWPESQSVLMGDYGSDNPDGDRQWPCSPGPTHQLRMIVWNDKLECYVDRERITTMPVPEGAHDQRFTIGEILPSRMVNAFRARNARIHRLRIPDPPDEESPDGEAHIRHAQNMIEIDPLSPTFWLEKGKGEHLTGRYEDSVASFAKCFALRPVQKMSRQQYGDALLALHRLPEAIEQYNLTLQQFPDQWVTKAWLGWIYAAAPDEKLRKADEAIALAEQACEASQRASWFALYVLAAAHANKGDFTAAQIAINAGLRLVPEAQKSLLEEAQKQITAQKPIRIPPRPTKQ